MKSRPIWSLWALVLCCAAAYSCGDDGGATCGEGTELIGGHCVPTDAGQGPGGGGGGAGGANGVACGDHTFMTNGKCQGLLPIGAACERGAQCESETCVTATEGFPGGYCTVPSCNDKRPCPNGSHCFFSQARDRNICLAVCDQNQTLRDDNKYVCQPIYGSDVNLLTPSCDVTDSCPDQTLCDKSSGKCVLRECDRNADDPCDTEHSSRICYQDRRNLTKLGGLCLSQCDPKASKCKAGDFCQPLPEDPANKGICVPPVCKATADCPVGSECKGDVCQPPARCDDQGQCSDSSTVCVGGAGGQCMTKCPENAKCSDIHAGLTCAQNVAAAPVCLPLGSFPGSACRADKNNACDSVRAGTGSAKMVCENDTCLVECASGGDALCKGIKDGLSCASGIYDAPVCLPNGAYPGGPCDAASSCQDVNLKAGVSAKMLCKSNLCVFDCAAGAIGSADAATYCADIDASLTCATAAYPGSAVCLPAGSYPGGPCAHGTCGKLGNTQMACEDNRCLLTCNPSDDTCGTVSASLVCAHGIFAQDVCLPKGAFPGGPCGGANNDECAQDLNGSPEIDMQCTQGKCVVGCSEAGQWAGYGEAICHFTDPSLTCAQAASSICVKACVSSACDAGYSCLDPGAVPTHENACLPNGSFPGSTCATGNTCGAGPNGSSMSCSTAAGGRCTYTCDAAFGATKCPSGLSCLASENTCLPNGSFPGAACAAGNTCGAGPGGSSMSCSAAAGGRCTYTCDAAFGSTKCPTGLSCLASENTCLPNGSFPGAACASGNTCGAGPGGSTMSCQSGTCLVNCPTGAPGEGLCGAINAALTCAETSPGMGGLCLPKCTAGACTGGLSCLTSEDACLPNGSFPGAACASGNTCGAGPMGSTMSCQSGTCLVTCSGSAGDTLCSGISAALTCSDLAGGFCLRACNVAYGSTKCPGGLSCLASENACLPNGSFLGSACASGNMCSGSPMLVCVPSSTPTCAAGCTIASGQSTANAYCTGVGNQFQTGYDTCTNVTGSLYVCTDAP